MLMKVDSCTHFHRILLVITVYNYFFELQDFVEKKNFINKSTKAKENVKLCITQIEKKYTHKII